MYLKNSFDHITVHHYRIVRETQNGSSNYIDIQKKNDCSASIHVLNIHKYIPNSDYQSAFSHK